MKLAGLRIFGFKTFAQATQLTFDSGITAIVGPNGSGKSNLVDAIRWALGEQSTKSLRSQKTDDVIFAGNDKRKALGLAEVVLTFDNSDGTINLPFQEIQITRRAYRAGEIEYFINKDRVRLRDVHELLMGTGLGPGSYAILSQGQIDAILVSKPSERRALFEETSGINKFLARKNEALRRIEGTNANVVRLNDLLREVEARFPELDSQIRRAKRYRSLSSKVRDLEILSSLRSTASRRSALAQAQEQVQAAEAAQTAAAQAANNAEATLQQLRASLQENDRQLEQARAAYDEARLACAAAEREQAASKARLDALTSQFTSEQSDAERRHEARARLHARIAERSAAIAPLQQQVEQLQSQATQANATLVALRKVLEERFAALRAFEAAANTHAQQIAAQQHQRLTLQRDVERMNAETQRIAEDIREDERNIASAQATLATNEAKLREQQAAHAAGETALAQAQQALTQANQAVPAAQARLRAATTELAAAEARLHTLEELEANLEGHIPGSKAIMDAHQRGELSGILGVVSTLVSVEEAYARALDTAFGAGVSNIITSDARAAEAAIDYLRTRELGRATLLPLELMAQRTGRELGRLARIPGVIAYAHDLVTVEERYRGVVAFLVGRTLIVDTMRTAVQLARQEQLRDTMVTLEGDQLLGGGAMSGGRNRRGERSLLARRAQAQTMRSDLLPNLREALLDAEADLAKAVHEANQLGAQRDAAQRTLAEITTGLNALQATTKLQQAQHQQASGRSQHLQQRHAQLSAQVSTLEEALAALPAVNDTPTDTPSERATHEAALQQARIEISHAEQEAQSTQRAAAQAREQCATLTAELEAAQQQLTSLDADVQRVSLTREQAAAELTRLQQELEQLATTCATRAQDSENRKQQLQLQQQTRTQLSAQLTQVEANVQRERENERALLARGEQARRRVAELSAELGMLETAAEQHAISTEEADDILNRYADAPDRIWQDLPKLREELNRLSQVNLNAEAERTELEARETTLRTQLDDLARARTLLLEGIRDLDVSCETQFLETFETVRHAFKDAYAELFPGGEARMWLTDPENVSTSGIEISVRPPGKKMTSLAALSGGERAMTAAALIFALIKVKPSPFYLLDEIDAALDEMNVERFSMMVRNLANQAQLLIVTHNKKTMELAQRMYGITMAEAGISSVVSASLDRELAHV